MRLCVKASELNVTFISIRNSASIVKVFLSYQERFGKNCSPSVGYYLSALCPFFTLQIICHKIFAVLLINFLIYDIKLNKIPNL
jgi:hypothetical protein